MDLWHYIVSGESQLLVCCERDTSNIDKGSSSRSALKLASASLQRRLYAIKIKW